MEEKDLFKGNLFGNTEPKEIKEDKVTETVEEVVTVESNDTEEVLEVIEVEVIDVVEDTQDFLETAEKLEDIKEDTIDINITELMEIDENQIIVIQDAKIQFKDYELLLVNVDSYLEQFKDMKFSDDQIKDAKKVRATLNKNITKLNKMRIAVKKQVMTPYSTLEIQVKEIESKINIVNNSVDSQIQAYEIKEKDAKGLKIQTFFNKCKVEYPHVTKHNLLNLKNIGKKEWGNKNYNIKKIKEEIKDSFSNSNSAISIIENLPNAARVLKIYKLNGFDLAEAQSNAIIEENEEKINQTKIDARNKELGKVAVTETELESVREETIKEVREQSDEVVVEKKEMVRVKFEMVGTLDNIMEVINFMKVKNNEGKIKVRELKEKGEK